MNDCFSSTTPYRPFRTIDCSEPMSYSVLNLNELKHVHEPRVNIEPIITPRLAFDLHGFRTTCSPPAVRANPVASFIYIKSVRYIYVLSSQSFERAWWYDSCCRAAANASRRSITTCPTVVKTFSAFIRLHIIITSSSSTKRLGHPWREFSVEWWPGRQMFPPTRTL